MLDSDLPKKIMILSGSSREPSLTMGLSKTIFKALEKRQAKPLIWDFRKKPLPIMQARHYLDSSAYKDSSVSEFLQAAELADAFVLLSPVYHNGLSGLLKNSLDFLGAKQMQYKAVGLCSHGGARTTQVVEQLRIITRGLNMYAIPSQVCTMASDFPDDAALKQDPLVSDQNILKRIDYFCDELCLMTTCAAKMKASLQK